MMHYQLRCGSGHSFEGWFRDSGAFEEQAARKLLSCPQCGTLQVDRALMAPSVRSSRKQVAEAVTASAAQTARDRAPDAPASRTTERVPDREVQDRGLHAQALRSHGVQPPGLHGDGLRTEAVLSDQMRASLQRIRAEVERHCDDVGDGFADAARRLHRGGKVAGARMRGIYGQVTESEREALADEGIETARIPWLPRAES